MTCSQYSKKFRSSPVIGSSMGKRAPQWVDFFSPFSFQQLIIHGACILPFDEINMVNTIFLAGFNNRTSWIMICKKCLHFCKSICLLSEGIVPLPHHGWKENMFGSLMTCEKKVMSDLIFFSACTKELNIIFPSAQYVSDAKWP